jgi:putative tryptophan/tyrosine transport system substrate-binding protein
MRRREFIALIGGAAAAWPLAVRAQEGERMRRLGVLMPLAADDPEAQMRLAALAQGLQQLGWTIGRNVRIETRWSAGSSGARHPTSTASSRVRNLPTFRCKRRPSTSW